ncbi:hypothetical protein PR048_023193 [Dryococelus australis]|uniref:Uncharacterized protein n=1 Tax=Dryococelus australis TaxID=614101 RepID=A0ABQ9GTG7_9NEOP|nr:hypothetical protein PR048_023193 [Dryococelus australis]
MLTTEILGFIDPTAAAACISSSRSRAAVARLRIVILIISNSSRDSTPRVARPGIEPGSHWWEAGSLTAQPPQPLRCVNLTFRHQHSSKMQAKKYYFASRFHNSARFQTSPSALTHSSLHSSCVTASRPFTPQHTLSAGVSSCALALGQMASAKTAGRWTAENILAPAIRLSGSPTRRRGGAVTLARNRRCQSSTGFTEEGEPTRQRACQSGERGGSRLSPPCPQYRTACNGTGSPDFRKWESCQTMPLVGGFSRGSPVSSSPSFRCRSIFTSITLIGSQDLAVKSRPNLFTHSFDCLRSKIQLKILNRFLSGCNRGDSSMYPRQYLSPTSGTRSTSPRLDYQEKWTLVTSFEEAGMAPHTFSNEEMAAIHFMYGHANGRAREAAGL